ncbi:BTAD domain-containing putative transcriptional regulator [Streptomyces capparidis]
MGSATYPAGEDTGAPPASTVRVRVLGPVAVEVEGQEVTLGPQQRVLLAALVLARGRAVSRERLLDLMWEDDVPEGAAASLRTHILNLRRVLEPRRRAHDGYAVLVSVGGRNNPGYALRLAEEQLDAARFLHLAERARRAVADADPAGALAALDQALALWRGPALDGVGDRAFAVAEATRLEEQRLAAHEDRVDALLALGRYQEVVGELTTLVGEHRLRERLWSQLILALSRSGRRADALAAYRQVYRLLDEELGVRPGRPLQELHQRILESDPEPAAPVRPRPAAPVPRQLPPDVASFTGRDSYVRAMDALLGESARPGRALVISSVSGTAGVGKTALAVHWMRRVADRFPDGQLHVNLRGYALTDPLTADQALGRLLRALGVGPAHIPVSQDEKESLYRSLLADRRMLLLLDDAASLEQVRPLLPGSASCLVVVTSRHDLRGLTAFHDARRISLDVFTEEESVALLARILGEERVRAEPEAARELARLCGHLPLALRICAANLAGGRHRGIADMARALREGDRFAELHLEGDRRSAVQATFDLSYDALPPAARRVFRLLGLVPGPDITAPAAAALAGCPQAEAERLLDQLAARHMIESYEPGRYHLHDLLRLYARERAEREDPAPEREAAVRRLLGWGLVTTDSAALAIYGPIHARFVLVRHTAAGVVPHTFNDPQEAWSWVNAERYNLLSCIEHAADHGMHSLAWQLADALHGHFVIGGQRAEWLRAAHAGLRAAVACRSELGQAAIHGSLADAYLQFADYAGAVRHAGRAVELAELAGARLLGETNRLVVGLGEREQGRLEAATAHLTRALEEMRRCGEPAGEGMALALLGFVRAELGHLDEALAHVEAATELSVKHDSLLTTDTTLRSLGVVHRYLGNLGEARRSLNDALKLGQESHTPYYQESSFQELALVLRDSGYMRLALINAERALQVVHRTNRRMLESDVLNTLGSILCRLGDVAEALDHHRRALRVAAEIGCHRGEAAAHVGMAAAHRGLARPDDAVAHARQAVLIARRHGFRLTEGEALEELAAAHAARGAYEEAARQAESALAVHRGTGYRLGGARSLELLGDAMAAAGEPAAARRCRGQALEAYEAMGVLDGRRLRAALDERQTEGVQSC